MKTWFNIYRLKIYASVKKIPPFLILLILTFKPCRTSIKPQPLFDHFIIFLAQTSLHIFFPQLAAIMFTDIAGYIALMGEDENKALLFFTGTGSCKDLLLKGSYLFSIHLKKGHIISTMNAGLIHKKSSAEFIM